MRFSDIVSRSLAARIESMIIVYEASSSGLTKDELVAHPGQGALAIQESIEVILRLAQKVAIKWELQVE